jgi:hypothetical protein
MPKDYYDHKGKHIGSSVESVETPQSYMRARREAFQNTSLIFLIVIILFIAFPLLAPSIWLWNFLTDYGVHDLFKIILSAAPALLMLFFIYRYKYFRVFYAGLVTVFLSSLTFWMSFSGGQDLIWSIFWALIPFSIGALLTNNLRK